jgi:hypothetical protein
MPDNNTQNASQNDPKKISREELEREAQEIRRTIAESERTVSEKKRFIEEGRKKIIESQPELRADWRELEMDEALEKAKQRRKTFAGESTYPEIEKVEMPKTETREIKESILQKPAPTPEEKTEEKIGSLREELKSLGGEGKKMRPQDQTEVPAYQLGPSLPEDLSRPKKSGLAEGLERSQSLNKDDELEEKEGLERYAVAPAKDLGTSDFEWQGKIGGVEIERGSPEESLERAEELPGQAEVLEDVEYPPSYATTSLEEKLKKAVKSSLEETPGVDSKAPADLEKKREDTYKEGDPYREPIE